MANLDMKSFSSKSVVPSIITSDLSNGLSQRFQNRPQTDFIFIHVWTSKP